MDVVGSTVATYISERSTHRPSKDIYRFKSSFLAIKLDLLFSPLRAIRLTIVKMKRQLAQIPVVR